MKLDDFDFHLPEGLIATRPARPRTAARLLLAQGDSIRDLHVRDLADLLGPGDLLVLNDTKVIPARLTGTRARPTPQGEAVAKVEVTLLEPAADGWKALAKPLRKLKPGEVIRFGAALSAEVAGISGGELTLRFDATGEAFDAALAQVGAMPLPPYIAALRAPDDADRQDYQTVWARRSGAVAAPTASLHFDDALLGQLAARGVRFAHVTLHVGAGTFLPIRVDDIRAHRLHAERATLCATTAQAITATRHEGGRIVAVGTTSLRTLETAARATGSVQPWSGETDLYITPGFDFRVVDLLLTNFHLPRTSLMVLVCAFAGRDRVMAAYAHALASDYRFASYGDATLLERAV